MRQADRDDGRRPDGLTTPEHEELLPPRSANWLLREEREILKEGGLVRKGDRIDPVQGFELVTAHQAVHRVATMCRLLGASSSGGLRAEEATAVSPGQGGRRARSRDRGDRPGGARHGWRTRIHFELPAGGTDVGRKRVARLMRDAGLRGVTQPRQFWTTVRAEHARPAPDLVKRDFAGRRLESVLGR